MRTDQQRVWRPACGRGRLPHSIPANLNRIGLRSHSIRVPLFDSGNPAQPAGHGPLRVRILLVLLLVFLTLCGQSFALACQEESHHASDHCCLLCHVGPLPFLQTTVAAKVAPIILVAWLAPAADFEPVHQSPLFACASRGPPAA